MMPQPVQKVCDRADVVAEGAVLVDEVVEQVSVLADEARGGRRVVVRAEEGRESRVGLEPGQRPAQGLGVDGDVGVEEEDRARPGGLGPRGSARRPGPAASGPGRRSPPPVRPGRPSRRSSRRRRRSARNRPGASREADGGSARSRGPRFAREPPPRATASAAPGSPDRRGHRP